MIVDKSCSQQILGSLLKHPQYLAEVDKYNLTIADFQTPFERYIFTAISGLFEGGASRITPPDVVNYLATNAIAKSSFEKGNGVEYLQDIEEFVEEGNFDYYYQRMKKVNLLNDLQKQGFDISKYYIEDQTNPKSIEVNKNFEKLKAQDITNDIKKTLLHLEGEYAKSEEVKVQTVVDGLEDLLTSFGTGADFGLPVQGDIFNEVISGARKGTLTIRSAGSGVGKTRNAVGDACYLAYPMRYDQMTCRWVKEGSCEKVLFILTEQNFEEIQKMILSYLTGINESRFRYGNFNPDETKLIKEAIDVIEKYKDNFTMIRMPEPTVGLLKAMVREQCFLKDVGYIFMDYIFISPALLNEFRDLRLRNDEALLLLTTCLKDLAVELNVCVFSSTQLNAKSEDNQDIRNESSFAGARSIINKADNGVIALRPSPNELETLHGVIDKMGCREPNIVYDVFKVRAGRWSQVRIWSYMDLGTLRKEDLFITDSRLNPVKDFAIGEKIKIVTWSEEEETEIEDYIKELNGEIGPPWEE